MSVMRESVFSLYILKAVSAVLIVFIHLPGIGLEATVLQPLMRIGVPCFFMITGYFLIDWESVLQSQRDNIFHSCSSSRRVIEQIYKVLVLTVKINIIYWFLLALKRYVYDCPIFSFDITSSNDYIKLLRILFVGDVIDSVFWYLTSLWEALVVIYFLLKVFRGDSNKTFKFLFLCTPLLLFCSILFNRYSFLMDTEFDISISRNFLLVAIPCITLGMSARKYKERLMVKRNTLDSLLVTTVILAYVEFGLLHIFDISGSGADFNMMTYPLAFLCFLFCCNHHRLGFIPKYIEDHLVKIGKFYSGPIYLYHSFTYHVLFLLTMLVPFLRYTLNAETVILVIIVTIITSQRIKDYATDRL